MQEPLVGEGDLVIRGFLDTSLRPKLISSEEGVLFYLPTTSPQDENRGGGVLRYSWASTVDKGDPLALEGHVRWAMAAK